MEFLNDIWNKTGKDINDFKEEIRKLSEQPKIEEVNMTILLSLTLRIQELNWSHFH